MPATSSHGHLCPDCDALRPCGDRRCQQVSGPKLCSQHRHERDMRRAGHYVPGDPQPGPRVDVGLEEMTTGEGTL